MRFAMITTFYPPYHFGGDGAFVRRLSHALAERDHAVEVIHDADAFRSLHTGDDPLPVSEPRGVTVHRLESRFPRLSCLATQQTGRPLVHGRKIQALLAAGRFDVIHFHNVSLVGGPGVLSYGDAVKVYTTHEHWLVCPTHILWRHGREPCPERQCLRCLWHHRRPPQLWRHSRWFERQTEHVDVFLSPSQFSADKHREFGFKRPTEVLPLFLTDTEPPGDSVSAPSDAPYFLFVGRLEKIKGLQDVIPLFGDRAPAELWVAGGGDYEPELRRLAAGRAKVRFLGTLAPDALRPLYAGALATIVPSRCYEVFPMVLLEAFREGVPVVARRLGPLPEVIEQSGGGLLFDGSEELEAQLQRLAAEPSLARSLGEAGRRAYEAHWTEESFIPRYLDLIARAAEKKRRAQLASRG